MKPRILVVEDDDADVLLLNRCFATCGYDVERVRTLGQARTAAAQERFDAMLLDLMLPDGNSIDWIPTLRSSGFDTPIIVTTGIDDVPTAVRAIKAGAENFLLKPLEMSILKKTLDKCLELELLRKREQVQQRLGKQGTPYFGGNVSTVEIVEQARIAASSGTVLLLTGETGTGKGVLARWIHDHSERVAQPFVEVNCSSLKGDLLRSELFGHARGAFTSAVKEKKGLLEVADSGTLFLDEIGDMDADVQAQMLKAIEEKSFRRLGETATRRSNFRLMCATNHDLKADAGFRRDLYFRICIFPIGLLPLRKRMDEIPGLSEYLLAEMGYGDFPLHPDVLDLLINYPWPGNTRELRNVLERALLLAQGVSLLPRHFPGICADAATEESHSLDNAADVHILQVVEKFRGDKIKASKALGLSVSSLYRRLAQIQKDT